MVRLLSTAPRALAATAEQKIYRVAAAAMGSPVADGLTMGLALLVGAVVPLLPYILIASGWAGLIAAVEATALVLFAVGYFVGWMADARQRWLSGLHFLIVAVSAAVIGYLIGLAIAPIGGTAAVPAP